MSDLSTVSDADLLGSLQGPAAPAKDLPSMIRAEAQAQGVPEGLALGVWHAEGRGGIEARSPKGAIGPMQLMPGTARDLGVDPTDLAQNIHGGVKYLGQQLATFKDPRLAAAAYNAGPGAVLAHGDVPPYPETQAYVRKALAPGAVDAAAPATPAAAAPPAAPPVNDLSGMSDAELLASLGDAGPKRKHPIVITNADTISPRNPGGDPYSDEIQGVYGDLIRKGQIDNRMPVGSREFPRVLADDAIPQPGEWYVDAKGLHQAPGVAAHTFGDDLVSTVGHAYGQLGRDIHDLGAGGPPPSLSELPARAGGDIWNTLTLPGDAAAAALSPLTGAIEGGVIQPLAGLADKLDLKGHSTSGLNIGQLFKGHLDVIPGRELTAQETHDATAGALRLGLSAIGDSGEIPQVGAAAHVLTPEQVAAARFAERKTPSGVTPATLRAAPQDITAGEALGQSGQVALGALARQSGRTGEELGNIITSRREGRGEQVLQAVSEAAGVPAEATRGAVDRMVERGRAEAQPLYDQAFSDAPIYSPLLEQLSRRPSVVKAAEVARRIIREEGEDPEALGISAVENPAHWASESPPAAEAEASPVGFAGARGRAQGPARPPSRGPSLAKYIADNGGIVDEGGEISAIGGDRWHVGKPFQRPLVGSLPAEDVAQRAFEAGYFPDRTAAPGPNELFDALDGEMRGKALYARPADPAAQQRFERANAAEERAYRGGDPADVPHPDDYVGRPEPLTEPAHQMQPRTKTWDYIKRGLDDLLKPYDTGKLEPTHESIAMSDTRAQLRDEAARLNPDYRRALDASGEYLSNRQAFRDGRAMIFNNRMDEVDFASRLKDMTAAQRRFLRAGIANRALELVVSPAGQPTELMNALRSQRVQAKLRMALGTRKADALTAEITKQARMKGFEDTYGPRSNSVTSTIGAEIADQQAIGPGLELGLAAARGAHGGPKGMIGTAAAHLVGKALAKARTAGMNEAVRDEAGYMLAGKPAELADVLEQLNRQSGPAVPLGRRVGRGLIGAGVIGHVAPQRPITGRGGQRMVP